jgi:hypothetical protein
MSTFQGEDPGGPGDRMENRSLIMQISAKKKKKKKKKNGRWVHATIRVSITVMKPHDQKQVEEERVYSAYTSAL